MNYRSDKSRGGDWSGLSLAMRIECVRLSWSKIPDDEKERRFIVAEAQERAENELRRLRKLLPA